MRAERVDAVTRALRRGFDPAGAGGLAVETLSARPWASNVFTGTRRLVHLRFTAEGGAAQADRIVATLEALEFALPRTIVADAALCARPSADTLLVELLLIDDV